MGIDLIRVQTKLEQCFDRGDYAAAERLLLFWRDEAVATGDAIGQKQIDNELLGLYRRTNQRDDALTVAERLLPTLSADSVEDCTILLNIATNYCHFGLSQKALPLYATVESVYRAHLPEDDYRLAGLYNNMAAYYCTQDDYVEAERLYEKALYVIRQIRPVMPETAVTLVNLAYCRYRQSPLDPTVEKRMQEAYRLLVAPTMHTDGTYAFVLSKVLPMFRHLGYADEVAHLEAKLRDGR